MPYRAPLDWLNFFLADVRGGLGPYLGIYLLTQQHWNQAMIGVVATVAGIVGLAVHAPAGALIDATYWKRGAIVAGLAVLAAGALAVATVPSFVVVLTAQTMMALAGALFGPAVAAITLGILGSRGLAQRMGRNAAFDHAGNVFIAALAGVVGWWFSQSAVFYLVPIFSVLAGAAVLSIPAEAIDHARARGLDRNQSEMREEPSGWRVLIACKPLLVFAACVTLFHFANAPMLPLVGQKLALMHKGAETALMSACIIAASPHSSSCCQWRCSSARRRMPGGASPSSWRRSRSCRSAACSIRSRTIRSGSSPYSSSTASARASSGC